MKKVFLVLILLVTTLLSVAYYNLPYIAKELIRLGDVQVEDIDKISIDKWIARKITYVIDETSKVEIEEVVLNIEKFNTVEGASIFNILDVIKAAINLEIKKIKYDNYTIELITLEAVKQEPTVVDIKNIYVSDFGKKNRGFVKLNLLDFSDINIAYLNINLDELVNYLDAGLNVKGYVNLNVKISNKNIHSTITSKDSVLTGFRLDEVISNFVESRSVGLIDAASIVALGPIGLLYTSAGSLGMTLGGFRGGETKFSEINITTLIEDNIVEFEDVAVATENNLVVANGSIDLSKETFNNIVISIVDEKFCPIIQQTLAGTFDKPDYSKTSAFVDTAVAPMDDITSKTFNFIGVSKCKPVYSGVVKYPKKKENEED